MHFWEREDNNLAIKGLTDRIARLPRVGIIRKGALKPERGPGRDQKFFRLQTEDPDLAMAWTSVFGDEPTSIDVYLAYDDPDDSFETAREEWAAGGLKHRCDGETCSIHLLPDNLHYSMDPVPCPYAEKVYEDPKKRPCQPIGKLNVLVPAMRRIGAFQLQTHSTHDIVSLSGNVSLYALLARQAGRSLSAIPCTLSRREREVSTPGDGKRQRRTISLVHLDISPKWAQIQFARLDHDLTELSNDRPLQLPAGTPEELVDPDDEITPSIQSQRPVTPAPPQQPAQNGTQLATPAQVRAAYMIGRDAHNMSEMDIDEQCTALFGVGLAELSRKQASDFITSLKGTESGVKQATVTPPSVTKTPPNSPAIDPLDLPSDGKIGVTKQASKAAIIWRELTSVIPELGLTTYFIPPELPANWDADEIREGGKALRAFVDGWKRMAQPAELGSIAEVIVAQRKAHGEEETAESLF